MSTDLVGLATTRLCGTNGCKHRIVQMLTISHGSCVTRTPGRLDSAPLLSFPSPSFTRSFVIARLSKLGHRVLGIGRTTWPTTWSCVGALIHSGMQSPFHLFLHPPNLSRSGIASGADLVSGKQSHHRQGQILGSVLQLGVVLVLLSPNSGV